MVFQKYEKTLDHERVLVSSKGGRKYPVQLNERMKEREFRKGAFVEVEFLEAGPMLVSGGRRLRGYGVHLTCTECGEEINERNVVTLGIEEDLLGKDVVLFVCPICDSKVRSHRRG